MNKEVKVLDWIYGTLRDCCSHGGGIRAAI